MNKPVNREITKSPDHDITKFPNHSITKSLNHQILRGQYRLSSSESRVGPHRSGEGCSGPHATWSFGIDILRIIEGGPASLMISA